MGSPAGNLGTINVGITADQTPLVSAISQASATAAAGGAQISAAFNQTAGSTNNLDSSISRLSADIKALSAALQGAASNSSQVAASANATANAIRTVGTHSQTSGFSVRYLFLGLKDIAEGRTTFALAELANEMTRLGPLAIGIAGSIAAVAGTIYGISKLADYMAAAGSNTEEARKSAEKFSQTIKELDASVQTLENQRFEILFGNVAAEAKKAADETNRLVRGVDQATIAMIQFQIAQVKAGNAFSLTDKLKQFGATILSGPIGGTGAAGALAAAQQTQKLLELTRDLDAAQVKQSRDAEQSAVDSLKSLQAQLRQKSATAEAAKDLSRFLDEAYREMLDHLKANHELQVGEELQFWQTRLAEARSFGDKYANSVREINNRVADLQQQSFRQYREAAEKDAKEQQSFDHQMDAQRVEEEKRLYESIKQTRKDLTEKTLEPRPDIEQIKIERSIESRLAGTPAGDVSRLQREGALTAQQRQASINQERDLLDAAQRANIPIAERLNLQRQILEAQIKLNADQGENDSADKLQLAAVTLQQAALQWRSLGLSDVAQKIATTFTEVPQALGGGLAAGIFQRGRGSSIGEEIAKSLRNVGQQLLGNIFTQAIQRLIAVTLGQTVATTSNTGVLSVHIGALAANTGAILAHVAATVAHIAVMIAHGIIIAANTIATIANTIATLVQAVLGFFAEGGPVTHDQIAMVHAGEHVLNRDQVEGRESLPQSVLARHVGSALPSARTIGFALSVPSAPVTAFSSSIESSSSTHSTIHSTNASNANFSGDLHFHAHGVDSPRQHAEMAVREIPRVLRMKIPSSVPYGK